METLKCITDTAPPPAYRRPAPVIAPVARQAPSKPVTRPQAAGNAPARQPAAKAAAAVAHPVTRPLAPRSTSGKGGGGDARGGGRVSVRRTTDLGNLPRGIIGMVLLRAPPTAA